MKVVAVPDIEDLEQLPNNSVRFQVAFPVEYTEIKHERVRQLKASFFKI